MISPPLEFPDIYRHVPHAGNMRLIDRVIAWDECLIVCASRSHRDRDNPLHKDGQLACVHAVEYAAQAMIIHASLRSGAAEAGSGESAPKAVYIASLRDIVLASGPLSAEKEGSLEISAVLDGEVGGVCNYRFAVTGATTTFATGQIVVLAQRAA